MSASPEAVGPAVDGEAFVRGSDEHDRAYEVREPTLTVEEEPLARGLVARLFEHPLPPPKSLADARRILRARIDQLAPTDPRLRDAGRRERLAVRIARDLVGYGPIDVPMRDPDIEDISCDGVDIPIFVHHRRYGSLPTNLRFATAEALDRYVVGLAQKAGRHLSNAEPLVEGTLPDGARLVASFGAQVTTRGSTFTIRRFRERALSPLDLVQRGTMSAEMAAYLWLAVEGETSFLVCGGTASGKTTTLNALLQFIPSERKVVSIEDTQELHLPQENWVALVTRGASARDDSGPAPAGSIDMFDLLGAALRQRPQYLVVGEVRGREAYTVFQAMATGKTCCATFHAESVRAMVHRMESAPIGLARPLIGALPLVLVERQVRIADRPARRIDAVVEIAGYDPETTEIEAGPVFAWDPATDRHDYTGRSRLLARIAAERGMSGEAMERELARRRELLELWSAPNAPAAPDRDLARGISAYARDPEGTLTAARSAARGSPIAAPGSTGP